MSLCRRLAGLLLIFGILAAGSAGADPILVDGVALGDREGVKIDLTGAHGLSIAVAVGRFDEKYLLPDYCLGSARCAGGATFPLTLELLGPFGTASFEGRTFEVNPNTDSGGTVQTFFDGAVILPPFRGQSSETVSAPFTFDGMLLILEAGVARPVPLAGGGTAFATFEPNLDFPDTWTFRSVRYQFDPAAPVPEPATLLLAGSGLIAIASRMRRRGRGAAGGADLARGGGSGESSKAGQFDGRRMAPAAKLN